MRPPWKVTPGRMNSGMNVPTICSASSAMAIRTLGRKRNVRPIATSHQPMIPSH